MKREELLYMGHPSQKYDAEEHRLKGGKGEGMRLLEIHNGKGMLITLCPDRCLDITRLHFKGDNMGYFSPCGYVAPPYYDDAGVGFLRSFTAGFLTTCGLRNAGNPSEDDGEALGLHGRIGNTPADVCSHWIEEQAGEDVIRIQATMSEARVGGEKLTLHRSMAVYTHQNKIRIQDTVKNEGTAVESLMLLYHFNMGYPLLTERAILTIPAEKIIPRNEHAATGLQDWMKMEKPTRDYEEMCFYHTVKKNERGMREVSLYNPNLHKGVKLSFDLPRFMQWKMMGQREYVLGLEPGNCTIDGRKNAREKGELDRLPGGEQITYTIEIELYE
ncbi:MAG TPA: DUF4432 domain-containing protein [Clostridiales bacterium]|nr:DUF4432 domain-containing protein [Clostridiales bacterium]